MKTHISHSMASLLLAWASFGSAHAAEPLAPPIAVNGNVTDNSAEDSDTLRPGTATSIGRPKSNEKAESLRCYQRGIRIISEELADGNVTQVAELSLATNGESGEHIAVMAFGDSLCVVHSKNKPIQSKHRDAVPAQPEVKKKS